MKSARPGIPIRSGEPATGVSRLHVLDAFNAFQNTTPLRAEKKYSDTGEPVYYIRERNQTDWSEEAHACLNQEVQKLEWIAAVNREAVLDLLKKCGLDVQQHSPLLQHINQNIGVGKTFCFHGLRELIRGQVDARGGIAPRSASLQQPLSQPSHGAGQKSKWIDNFTSPLDGSSVHRADLWNIDTANHGDRLESLKQLLYATSGPLRLQDGRDKNDNKVLYIRERTWSEFFEEHIMGLIWPHQLVDMKRDTALMIENALSQVISHIRKQEHLSQGPADIGVGDVNELIGALQHRVLVTRSGQTPLGCLSEEHNATNLPSKLHGLVLGGVKRAPLAGCSVVQAHPLGFGANNIIVPLPVAHDMRAGENRVLQQAATVVRKAERKFTEHLKWNTEEADRKRKKENERKLETESDDKLKEYEATSLPPKSGGESARPDNSLNRKTHWTPISFPMKTRSVLHTRNLFLLDREEALGPNDGNRSEEFWHGYYSSLLGTLDGNVPKGTVVIAPYPDRQKSGFSDENLHGLVRACLERSSVRFACEQQTELLSITIAHPDESVVRRIKTRLAESSGIPVNQIPPETDAASSLRYSPDLRPLHERMPHIFARSDDGEDNDGGDSDQFWWYAALKKKGGRLRVEEEPSSLTATLAQGLGAIFRRSDEV